MIKVRIDFSRDKRFNDRYNFLIFYTESLGSMNDFSHVNIDPIARYAIYLDSNESTGVGLRHILPTRKIPSGCCIPFTQRC